MEQGKLKIMKTENKYGDRNTDKVLTQIYNQLAKDEI